MLLRLAMTRCAVGRDAALLVASDAVRHFESPDRARRARRLCDVSVAPLAADPRFHDMASMRIEDVSGLAEQTVPDERPIRVQNRDESCLFRALPQGLGMAGCADPGVRQPGEGLALVVDVARGAADLVVDDMLPMVERDRLALRGRVKPSRRKTD